VESILITPICPHTLSDRPVVVRDTSKVELRLSESADSVFLTLDGQTGVPMQRGDRVRITAPPNASGSSSRPTKLLRDSPQQTQMGEA